MNILLIGPYFANAGHGAEIGIYDALIELGHAVDIWDFRVHKFKIHEHEEVLTEIDQNSPSDLVVSRNYDFVLSPGAGLTDTILQSKIFKSLDCLKVIWNSEPIRLNNYKGRIARNKDHFHAFFTFDESEISLYNELDIDASWLPQGFNNKWYRPLNLSSSQRFDDFFVFIGSINNEKWLNREYFLDRVKSVFNVNIASIFDAEKVNRAYNMHAAVLNLGLYLPEFGHPSELRAEALQQRVFESIGAGKLCITNRVAEGTNELFEHGKNILFYDKDNLEEVLSYAMEKVERKRIEKNILEIRDQHTYKARMTQLLNMLEW